MREEVLLEFLNPDNWRPHMSQIAKKTNTAISVVSENFKKLKEKGKIEIKIRELTTEEALERRQNDIHTM